MTFTSVALTAPAPISTRIVSPELGLYRSPLGFKIDTADTDWELIPAPKKSKYVITSFRSKSTNNKGYASLTVRRDPLAKSQSIEGYIQKWLNQYPRFGFDVSGAKKIKIKDQKGYLIDLVSRDGKKQLRQVVYMRDKDAFVLTCRDNKENFKNSLKSCNKIIRSFAWTENTDSKVE